MAKKDFTETIKKMNFCPVCGKTLTWFGSVGGDYKNCPDGCGVMTVYGTRRGVLPGLLFEVTDESGAVGL